MRNKFPKGQTIVVEEVSPIGVPIQPDGVCSRFASAIGAVVRDILDCSIQHWNDVPDSEKTKIWKNMMGHLVSLLIQKSSSRSWQ